MQSTYLSRGFFGCTYISLIGAALSLGALLDPGTVTAQEQAFYLAGGFVLWLSHAYLYIDPGLQGRDPWWFYSMWFYEFALLIVISVAGVMYCLGKARIEPSRHFLIDFSCLYFPISLTTLVVVWALFWAINLGRLPVILWWIDHLPLDRELSRWPLMFDSRFSDLIRFLAVVVCNFVVFYRIGRHIGRIAQLRESANPTVEGDAPQAARPSP